MSDTESSEDKQFEIEVAKNGRAGCKKCKQKCLQGEIRIAKIVPNPFGEGKMRSWHHLNCLFEAFKKQRATTKRIETEDDIAGFELLEKDDQNLVNQKICEIRTFFGMSAASSKPKKVVKKTPEKSPKAKTGRDKEEFKKSDETNDDNLFKTFQHIVAVVAKHASYLDKTGIIRTFFEKGTNKKEFEGDIEIWCRLLLPQSMKRIYNLQSKQLVKLFSRIFSEDQEEMLEHLEKGDISETISHFYQESRKFKPLPKESTVTIQRIDTFLEYLSKLTKEDDQISHFDSIIRKLTPDDLRTIIRLIKHDLRMGAGPKHILEGIHPDAYKVYHASKDLDDVVSRCFGSRKGQSADIKILTPVFPMLAEACKSVEQAMKKCVNGMYSEIKYDGERVQVHKHGSEFKYFSRSLKPVMPHKVAHFKDYIDKAFPHAKDLILDCEILMMDVSTGKPLPFGTLGVHKKVQFKDATVCLFVFDCIYYNGKSLMKVPLKERKRILSENMTEVPNHIVFSEMKEIDDREALSEMIADVLKQGLEGLVLKDVMSIYEPGKRHWLKVKKDYLFGGAMADSADLIVLGAWYGTGKKGGMMSVFLMGCYNPHRKKFCTVTKVHTGHDDKTLERLQTDLKMEKISGDPQKVPSWLVCTRTMVPDFVAVDPKQQPVWEITGAEFTQQHDVHTADGISIRFPRVTKIRDDKDWKTATNLDELRFLFKKSKEDTDVSLLLKGDDKKRKLDDDSSSVTSAASSSYSSFKKSPKDSPSSSRDASVTSLESPRKKIKREHIKVSHTDEISSNNETLLDKKKRREEKHDDSLPSTSGLLIKKKSAEESNSPKKKFKANINTTIMRVKVKEPLTELFEGIKGMFLGGERSEAERYFIAYGGLTDIDIKGDETATHIFHFTKKLRTIPENLPKTARNLHANWIVDSVNNMKLEDSDAYTVLWVPEKNESNLDFDVKICNDIFVDIQKNIKSLMAITLLDGKSELYRSAQP